MPFLRNRPSFSSKDLYRSKKSLVTEPLKPLGLCNCHAKCDDAMALEQEAPLTEKERKKLHELVNDPRAIDNVLDKALKGWRRGKSWKKVQTKKS